MTESSAPLTRPHARVRSRVDWITPALVAIFVLSGASGLIYQMSWVRLLSLTFGVTIYAISIVVAAFMGGLALGSVLGGRLADRVRQPILWYAAAEAAVAGLGLLSPYLLAWVQSAYVALYPRNADDAVIGLVVLRFGLGSAVLLVPTTLMGATLPLMVKSSLAMGREIGARVSWLYAGNTAGAILGTVGAGFFLIGALGISGTIHAAAICNLAAALAALALGAGAPPSAALTHTDATDIAFPDPGPVTALVPSPMVRGVVIAAFAVQGFASLAYEIVWTRILALILDGSTYAFSTVLATVLLGIALGSALVGPLIGRSLPWLRIAALLQAGVAAVAILGLVVFAHVFPVVDQVGRVGLLRPVLDTQFGWMAAVALIAILPPMLLLGASFPIAARIVVPDARTAGRELGLLYAGNTAGAILGAWTAGFLLIPTLGTQSSIILLAGTNTILALALALVSGPRWLFTAAASLALVGGSLLLASRFAPEMYRRVVAAKFQGTDLVWVGEGKETSVAVVRSRANGVQHMFINGQGQANDDPGMVAFHRLLGQLPMTLHPDPQDVLIVGLGGGATAGALAQFGPRHMEIVELSDTVIEGAGYFSHVNGRVLEYPNLQLRIDDGRNHLLLTDQRYDVVTADVSHPRNAGAALLYSQEYYRQVAHALRSGGLMSQWLEDNPSNPDNEAQRQLMARTFLSVFPYVSLWNNGTILLGSNEPVDARVATVASRWGPRRLDDILAGSSLSSPGALPALLTMTDPELRAWAGDGPVMTDDRPLVEYFLSLPGGNGARRR